jgi:hypothetical protein
LCSQGFKWEISDKEFYIMSIIRNASITLLCTFVLLSGCQKAQTSIIESLSKDINCPGTYSIHQQGIATDGKTAIFWSHTIQLAKTDLQGNLLKVIDVPNHHGDLDYCDQKVYVAVNLGKFNGEGQADSWVYVYDAEDLSFISKHPVPEVVFGAGGIAIHNGRFIVVGGLPNDYQKNYVYEYDKNFNFVKRHIIKSGHTALGIQTAVWFDGYWWFGCYGMPDNPGLLKTDDSFNLITTYDLNFSYGIIGIKGDKFLRGDASGKAMITYVRP